MGPCGALISRFEMDETLHYLRLLQSFDVAVTATAMEVHDVPSRLIVYSTHHVPLSVLTCGEGGVT